MAEHFDLIVLGSGTAGQIVAYRCRRAGWSVAMVETREPGGTCANRGCDAKKPFVNAAEAVEQVRRLRGKGIHGNEIAVDWTEAVRFKRTFTGAIPDATRRDLAEAGIELIEARPRFTGPQKIEAGGRELEGGRIVIATGFGPRPLEMPGHELLTTSDELMELESLPKRVAFVGGGYISCEFAHTVARAGADVTIAEQRPRILGGFDADLAGLLTRASEAAGIGVVTGTCVTRLERTASGIAVVCERTGWRHEADLVVHGAGRVPQIADLDLDRAGVETGPVGVTVNEHLQSVSNPAVYAVGDVAATDGMPLTPVANMEGKVLAHNLLAGDRRTCNYTGVPSAVFTTPRLAMVGLTEEQTHEQGIDVIVNYAETGGAKQMRQLGVEHVGYKGLVERGSGRIVGVHVLGPHAEEVVNIFAVAIRNGLTARQVRQSIFTYPTQTSLVAAMLKED